MSNTMRLVALSPLQTSKSLYFPCNRSCVSSRFISDLMSCSIKKSYVIDGRVRALTNFSEEGAIGGVDSPPSSSSPVSIELKPILNESQFDRVIAAAQQLGKPVVILWMATWCRKCIYLKPKLEKLAADYHPRVGFYCTDVNNVPHKLVARAGVTKMPSIQLWKDCKKQAEVIGGHKAYLVINEVREMIDNEDEL